MTSRDEVRNLNRLLKGAALNVLVALNYADKPLTAVALQEETGWSDKPVRKSVELMEKLEFAEHLARNKGWIITAKGRIAVEILTPRKGAAAGPRQAGENGVKTGQKNSSTFTGVKLDVAAETGTNEAMPRQAGKTAVLDTGTPARNEAEDRRNQQHDQICSDLDLIRDISSQESDLIKSDLTQAARGNGDGRPADGGTTMKQDLASENQGSEQEALAIFLKRIGIENPAYDEILARDRLVDVVAWHWAILGEKWMNNPRGWMITCLKNGDKPAKGYCEFARLWLTMSQEDYADYVAVRYQPFDLQDYWREWDLSPEEMEVLDRVKRHGGLELFEEFERPILNGECGVRDAE